MKTSPLLGEIVSVEGAGEGRNECCFRKLVARLSIFFLSKLCSFAVTATTVFFLFFPSISNTLQDLVFCSTKSFSHTSPVGRRPYAIYRHRRRNRYQPSRYPSSSLIFFSTPLSSLILLPPYSPAPEFSYQPHNRRNPIFNFQPTRLPQTCVR